MPRSIPTWTPFARNRASRRWSPARSGAWESWSRARARPSRPNRRQMPESAHVFISYARSSEEQARQVGEALRGSGYSVWRDDELPAHRAYSDVIEERLKSAKAVVVLWCAESAKSHWVRAEADAAREAGTLVQATLDSALPPMPFNQIQCADLKDWHGDTSSPGWHKLEASVAALVGGEGEDAGEAAGAAPRVQAVHASICVLP